MNPNDDQKPTDEVPPITNTRDSHPADENYPEFETGTDRPAPAAAPEWFEVEGTHKGTALPLAQHAWIDRFLNHDKAVRLALDAMLDHVGDARTGHLFPIPQSLVDQSNSEGPFATNDPTLRRYGATFGVTARTYTRLATALGLIEQATREVVNLSNSLARETKLARGDNPARGDKPAQAMVALGPDGLLRPVGDESDLKAVQEALAASGQPQQPTAAA